MKNDEFEYIEEKKPLKKNKLLLVIIILILVGGAVFAVFKFANLELPWKKEDKKMKEYIQELESQNKGYSKESDLIITEFQNKEISKVRDFNIVVSDLDADRTGYIFDMTITNQGYEDVNFDCTTILIDGYETSENFSVDIVATGEEKIHINIKKTDLLQLEIRDFNKLTFIGKIVYSNGKKRSFKFDLLTAQIDQVKNEKVGLTKIDEFEDLMINYYKKVEDNNNYYLYFDVKNNGTVTEYDLAISELFLSGKAYVDDIHVLVRSGVEKIFYVSIPKDRMSSFDTFDISFFVLKTNQNEDKEIYITNSKKIYL